MNEETFLPQLKYRAYIGHPTSDDTTVVRLRFYLHDQKNALCHFVTNDWRLPMIRFLNCIPHGKTLDSKQPREHSMNIITIGQMNDKACS